MPTTPQRQQEMTPAHRRLISGWLFLLCFMLLGMIAIGGVTRLTGSGLSIMDWQPVSGMIPPLSHAEWERLFALYQTIPQYHLQHEGFGLEGFQKFSGPSGSTASGGGSWGLCCCFHSCGLWSGA